MNVICLGDIVGREGCAFVRSQLRRLKQYYQADVVIANGENSASGNGMLPQSIESLLDAGVDVVTSGNHALRRREIYEYLDEDHPLIRPYNLHPATPGRGLYLYDMPQFQLCVINLMGHVYMDGSLNPFTAMDELLSQIQTPNILVDFHAEATAEKIALGYHLDGRVSAVVGTHTHVQTADERILPRGTAYITDLGMCGAIDSVLGVDVEQAVQRMQTHLPVRFKNAFGPHRMTGVFIQIDTKTGKALEISRISVE